MLKMQHAELVTEIIGKLPGAEITNEESYWCAPFKWRGLNWSIANDKNTRFKISIFPPRLNPEGNTSNADKRWKELTTEIGVSVSKGADKIVSDINRRFDFDAIAAVAEEYRQANEEHKQTENASLALAQRLQKLTGWKLYSRDKLSHEISNSYGSDPYVEIKVSVTSVSVSIRSIDDENRAAEIVAAISQITEQANFPV